MQTAPAAVSAPQASDRHRHRSERNCTMRCTARSSLCRRLRPGADRNRRVDLRAIFLRAARIVRGVVRLPGQPVPASGGSTRLRSTARWRGKTRRAVRPGRWVPGSPAMRSTAGSIPAPDARPDPLEAAMFGAEAVAYRPQMMLWFSNLPVAAFDGKVPFVSCKIGDVTTAARCRRRHQPRRGAGAVRLFALARIRQHGVSRPPALPTSCRR